MVGRENSGTQGLAGMGMLVGTGGMVKVAKDALGEGESEKVVVLEGLVLVALHPYEMLVLLTHSSRQYSYGIREAIARGK